jgi:cytochrome c-type biogenesis protein CcmH/NrfF
MMEPLAYDYIFTGLTLLFWLSPVVLLMLFFVGYYMEKRKTRKQVV